MERAGGQADTWLLPRQFLDNVGRVVQSNPLNWKKNLLKVQEEAVGERT